MGTKDEDFLEHLFNTTTHHFLLCFTNQGRVYRLKVHELPEAGRQARGTAIVNLLQLGPGEKITALMTVREFKPDQFIFFATRNGIVKRTDLTEFDSSRKGGLIAITLDEGDELIAANLTQGHEEALLITAEGQSIRFSEEEVRSMGRAAHGVKGITLERDDAVVGMETIIAGHQVLVVTDRGFGKRTPVEEYRSQSRGGKGVRTITLTRKNGSVIGFEMVEDGQELMTLTGGGHVIRMAVSDIPVLSRYAQGVTVMRMAAGTTVVATAKLAGGQKDEEEE
jgi:DNA gyrase subunit A